MEKEFVNYVLKFKKINSMKPKIFEYYLYQSICRLFQLNNIRAYTTVEFQYEQQLNLNNGNRPSPMIIKCYYIYYYILTKRVIIFFCHLIKFEK